MIGYGHELLGRRKFISLKKAVADFPTKEYVLTPTKLSYAFGKLLLALTLRESLKSRI